MEYDRKSAVSSFYGDRRSSVDALNRDYTAAAPTTAADPRSRRDSSSSFFNPAAATANLPRGATEPVRVQSAGYNRMSYFDAGREEPVKGGYDEVAQAEQPNEGGWDVYADFNNAGPRYSHAFGLGDDEPTYVEICLPVSPLVLGWPWALPPPLTICFFFEAISSSPRLALRRWTKSPHPRDPSNW
jgi:hypothetical protein